MELMMTSFCSKPLQLQVMQLDLLAHTSAATQFMPLLNRGLMRVATDCIPRKR
jgi:hypothetical protein